MLYEETIRFMNTTTVAWFFVAFSFNINCGSEKKCAGFSIQKEEPKAPLFVCNSEILDGCFHAHSMGIPKVIVRICVHF